MWVKKREDKIISLKCLGRAKCFGGKMLRGLNVLDGAKTGAAEKTRTSTGLTPQRPQRCASTNSATAASSVRQVKQDKGCLANTRLSYKRKDEKNAKTVKAQKRKKEGLKSRPHKQILAYGCRTLPCLHLPSVQSGNLHPP